MTPEPSYLDEPENPFRDAIKLVAGGAEPPPYVRGYSCADMTEDEYQKLTEWLLNDGLPAVCSWTTGIGLIEAAEHIVREAVANGNIPDKPEGIPLSSHALKTDVDHAIPARDDTDTDRCPSPGPPDDDEMEIDHGF